MWNMTFCQQAGNRKKRNQDALFNGEAVFQYQLKKAEKRTINRPHLLFGVADGISHSQTPHIASRYWMEKLSHCESLPQDWVRSTHQQFCEELAETCFGSATTFVAAELNNNDKGKILNIGDSRAYLIKSTEEWIQLSFDHIVLNDLLAESAEKKSKDFARIYYCLSDCLVADFLATDFRIHCAEFHLEQGDCLLLCSDGLTNFVPEIMRLKIWQMFPDMTQRLTALRNYVRKYAHYDDLSIVVCEYKK